MNCAPCVIQCKNIKAACYVDGLLIFWKLEEYINNLMNKLSKNLTKKYLGRPVSFLGTKVNWKKHAVYLRQNGLIKGLLEDNTMTISKALNTPMNCNPVPRDYKKFLLGGEELREYRSIVGSLMFIPIKTRSGLCVAVSTLGTYVGKPCRSDLVDARRALRYLDSTAEHSIMLRLEEGSQLSAPIDSNWACQHKLN